MLYRFVITKKVCTNPFSLHYMLFWFLLGYGRYCGFSGSLLRRAHRSYRAGAACTPGGSPSCPCGAASRSHRWSSEPLCPPDWGNKPPRSSESSPPDNTSPSEARTHTDITWRYSDWKHKSRPRGARERVYGQRRCIYLLRLLRGGKWSWRQRTGAVSRRAEDGRVPLQRRPGGRAAGAGVRHHVTVGGLWSDGKPRGLITAREHISAAN